MGDNRKRVSDPELAFVDLKRKEGLSAAQIGKLTGRTRNAVAGVIDRHLKATPRRAKEPGDGQTRHAPPPRCDAFDAPSPPRRFSWEQPA